MAGLNFEADYADRFDVLKVFAAEGVEFLLSCEGKVYNIYCRLLLQKKLYVVV